MKILIVSSSDVFGGAAKAAYRLHCALLKYNVDSQMLVMRKVTDDVTIIGPKTKFGKAISMIKPSLEKLIVSVLYRSKQKSMFSPGILSSKNILKEIQSINPDIVHLCWINGGMIKIEDLKKIKSPILWSLQDMWPFTGGCHFSGDCERYLDNCGSCKELSSVNNFDISRITYNRKLKSYSKIQSLAVNGVSQWIANCAKKSSLFANRHVTNIPNTIDTDLFRLINKEIARKSFGIPNEKNVLLFGAASVNDPRKGYKSLLNALTALDYPDLVLVVAGQSKPINPISVGFPVYYIPPIHDDVSLSLMYNVADVVIVPSLQENLSNMIIESMSCGVPVVAYDIGGNGDIINHKINGYLAKILDKNDMAHGISWSLRQRKSFLSNNARKKALNTFSHSVVVEKYINLYKTYI